MSLPQGLFPRDDPRNTRFAINYFTAIDLGYLTEELREWLKTAPAVTAPSGLVAGLDDSSSGKVFTIHLSPGYTVTCNALTMIMMFHQVFT